MMKTTFYAPHGPTYCGSYALRPEESNQACWATYLEFLLTIQNIPQKTLKQKNMSEQSQSLSIHLFLVTTRITRRTLMGNRMLLKS
jgi:hypothetical protein